VLQAAPSSRVDRICSVKDRPPHRLVRVRSGSGTSSHGTTIGVQGCRLLLGGRRSVPRRCQLTREPAPFSPRSRLSVHPPSLGAPAMPCAWARRLHDEPAVMTETRADDVDFQDTLREQETEFYETLIAVLANLPPGSTVDDALRSPAGERARQKWTLKYGREAPL